MSRFSRQASRKIADATKIVLSKPPGDPLPQRSPFVGRGTVLAIASISTIGARKSASVPTVGSGTLVDFPPLDDDAPPGTDRSFEASSSVVDIYNCTDKVWGSGYAVVFLGPGDVWYLLSPTSCSQLTSPGG